MKTDPQIQQDVRSWIEREAVVGAAWGTRGVEWVIDKLHISP